MGLSINNVNTLQLLNILNRTSTSQSDTLTRLSTGSRINKGSDDPAGLIALRGLESESRAVDSAISNNQRTDAFLNVADKALGEVSKLLGDVQKLAAESSNTAGLTADQLAANQAQIDNAVAAIDRIIGTTEFNGRKLLDGSLGIGFSANSSYISDVQIFSRNTASGSQSLTVSRDVAATTASAVAASGGSFTLSANTTIEVRGKNGSSVIDLASGASLATIASQVNTYKTDTGVSAYVNGSNQLQFNSTDFGDAAFVNVRKIGAGAGTFANATDSGSDAVVTINGQKAAVDGLNVNFNLNGLSLSFNITESFNTSGGSQTLSVTTDGGATFQLGTEASTRATIGINGLFSQQLGTSDLGYIASLKSGGANDLLTDPGKAAQIATAASAQVAKVQGRIGGFQKFQVQTALNQANATKEGLSSAISTIADVDYATETAELNRQNVLLQSAISLLGLANQQSSQVLSLLR